MSKPITRKQAFLAKIAGEDVTIEPKTYDELFLNAIAEKRGGEDVELPQPNTMEQAYLKKIADSIIGGGGGGDSDFSIAEVTLTNTDLADDIFVYMPFVYDDNEFEEGRSALLGVSENISHGESKTFKVALYKGLAFGDIPTSYVTTTGDITFEDGYGVFITGDGTVSFHYGNPGPQ